MKNSIGLVLSNICILKHFVRRHFSANLGNTPKMVSCPEQFSKTPPLTFSPIGQFCVPFVVLISNKKNMPKESLKR